MFTSDSARQKICTSYTTFSFDLLRLSCIGWAGGILVFQPHTLPGCICQLLLLGGRVGFILPSFRSTSTLFDETIFILDQLFLHLPQHLIRNIFILPDPQCSVSDFFDVLCRFQFQFQLQISTFFGTTTFGEPNSTSKIFTLVS